MSATKTAERRQGRTGPPPLTIVTYDDRAAAEGFPAPPSGLSPETSAAWTTYWTSPLAAAVTLPTDMPALRRLFRMYDDLERSWALYMANPEVEGSTGQTRISHFAKHIAETEPLIRALEDRFGLSPKARLELGVTLGDAARSLKDLYSAAPTDPTVPSELFVQGAAVRVPGRP